MIGAWLRRRAAAQDERQGLLFDENAPPASGAPAETGAATPASSPASSPASTPAPSPAATSPAPEPLPHEASPSIYVHPQASRRVCLQGVEISYAFARGRRRSIGMVIGPEGLSVRAPRWVSLRDVEAALQERAAWVVKHLQGQEARAAKARERDDAWCDGGTVLVHGEPVRLVLDATLRGCVASWRDAVPPPGATLRVGLRADARSRARGRGKADDVEGVDDRGADHADGGKAKRDLVRNLVHAWLQAQACTLFAQRCAHYAPQLGVEVRRLGLSAARTRWGSAGIDGSIRLNWRLMHHPLVCIDYVVVHELAHLRHMNHGPAFWALVASVLPDHRETRRLLRDEAMSE